MFEGFPALLLCLALCLGGGCSPASALIALPATLDGPSPVIGEFGGAAVSADGSGGVIYTKQIAGVQHVFAAQFSGGQWHTPLRVDWDIPYGATYPRIAAADGGWLVAVWVGQIATVKGRVQDALYSSTLQPGASEFGTPYIVDPNVGEGAGVSPSLAIAANGQGLVAYRAVTDNFKTTLIQTTVPQLRPGDVLADVRVATYQGQLWSGPVRIDRDPLLSTRPPSEDNGPQAGIGRGDQAVVAWQESESNGVARIWSRRLFGSTLGLAMQASPTTLAGQPVTVDADAFALGVSEFGEAEVVSRLAAGTALSPRLFLNTLPVSTAPNGKQFSGPKSLAGSSSEVGVPSVAVDDQGDFRVAFRAGSSAAVLTGGERTVAHLEVPLGAATAGTVGAVTALNPQGGGVTAWPSRNPQGLPAIAVREDFPTGAAQAGLLSAILDGPISALAIGGSESGEALIGAREGASGGYEIVGARVTAPPPTFYLEVPDGWTTPTKARVSWSSAEDATGSVTYALAIDGNVVERGIRALSVTPTRRLLGSGVRNMQVIATDSSGQQTLSGEAQLKVDGTPPLVRVRKLRGGRVLVNVKDAQSGAVAGATRISFGDGAHLNGRLRAKHAYAHAGRYVIVVRVRDRLGNGATARIRVSIR